MDEQDLASLIADLRSEGGDVAEVEVKRAAGGFPESLAPTLSAFGNTPGGGLIIFGLGERRSFDAVGVYDVVACKQAVASSARHSVEPPLTLSVTSMEFDGAAIIVATVNELAASAKPCRAKATGRAYLRSHDGDYALSEVEEQAFIANRSTPRFDEQPVAGATRADLDPDLVAGYCRLSTEMSPALRRFDDNELLFRTGVLVGADKVPSVAGLLTLGLYPQQFFPNLVVQASAEPRPDDPPGTRVGDARRFDGPLPTMLDEAVRWVARNSRTRIRFGSDGQGHDEPEYPLVAVRELVSNALVHRDLGPYALGEATTLRITGDQLILSNPGGLYGISADRLGTTGVTSARNGYLVRIGQYVRTSAGNRVVEALATGIPTVLRSLAAAGMVPPRFHDQGIRFTVRVPRHALLDPDTEARILAVLRGGPATRKAIERQTSLSQRQVQYALQSLRETERVELRGSRGSRNSSYVLVDDGRDRPASQGR